MGGREQTSLGGDDGKDLGDEVMSSGCAPRMVPCVPNHAPRFDDNSRHSRSRVLRWERGSGRPRKSSRGRSVAIKNWAFCHDREARLAASRGYRERLMCYPAFTRVAVRTAGLHASFAGPGRTRRGTSPCRPSVTAGRAKLASCHPRIWRMCRVRRENQAVTHRPHVIESSGWPKAQSSRVCPDAACGQVGSRSDSARCNPHKGSVGYVPRSKAVPHGANEWMWRARRRETRADRRKF